MCFGLGLVAVLVKKHGQRKKVHLRNFFTRGGDMNLKLRIKTRGKSREWTRAVTETQ